MAWSISPSTASIDDSGNAWFPEAGDNSKTYRITYTDGDGCSSSTTYTVPGCSPTDCTVYQFINLNAEEGAKDNVGTGVAMSTKSKSPLTFSRSDSDSWITYLSTGGDSERYVYVCKAENNSGGYREGRAVFVSDDGCEFVATVRQKALSVKHTYTLTYVRYEASVGIGDVVETHGHVKIINGLTRDGVSVPTSDYEFMVIADVTTCQHVPELNQCTTEQNVNVGESDYYFFEDNTTSTVDLYGEEYHFKRIKIVYQGTTIYDEDVVPCDDDCDVTKELNFEA